MKRILLITHFTLMLVLSAQDRMAPVIPAPEVQSYNEIQKILQTVPGEALKMLQELPASRSAAFDYLEGALLAEKKQWKLAESQFLSALKKFPQFYKAHVALTSVYLNSDDSKKALKHLYEIVKAGRADGDVWKNIVYCHVANKHYHAAAEALENVRIFLPEDPSLNETFLDLYLRQELYEKALPLALELLDNNPKEKKYWQQAISCFMQLQKPQKALQHYQLFDKLFDLSEQELMELAGLLYNQGLFRQAALKYGEIKGALVVSATLNRAACLWEIEEFTEVLSVLEKDFPKASPQDKEKIFFFKGNALRAMGDLKSAEKAYLESLSFNSLSPSVNFNLAEIYDQQKFYQKALERYELAAKDSFYGSSSYLRKARIYALQKEYHMALAEAAKALDLDDSEATRKFYNQIKALIVN